MSEQRVDPNPKPFSRTDKLRQDIRNRSKRVVDAQGNAWAVDTVYDPNKDRPTQNRIFQRTKISPEVIEKHRKDALKILEERSRKKS